MRRAPRKPVEPHPPLIRGESEFEEKRIKCDSTLVITKAANSSFDSFSQSMEYVYRQAYFAGKAAGRREQGEEFNRELQLDASVRETAGAQKEKQDGIIKSD
jgi:hypothetical protein